MPGIVETKIAAHRARVAAHNAALRASRMAPLPETPDLVRDALRLALPIVERAAAATPTTPSRMDRQREAARAAAAIRAALSA